ncbi:MAG: signal peptidase I [Acidimicrobiales bacterium]
MTPQVTSPLDQDEPSEPTSVPGEITSPKASSRRWLIEWAVILIVALGFAVLMRTFVVQTFFIPSGSMLPTLQVGDRILVNKLSYKVHDIHRGDIVVFGRPALEPPEFADLVKRVVGLPGETISAVNDRVYIDGKELNEPWLPKDTPTLSSPNDEPWNLSHPYTIPKGEYFVMGDNRTISEDSRYFGPIPKSLIVGRVFFRIWPLSRLGGL